MPAIPLADGGEFIARQRRDHRAGGHGRGPDIFLEARPGEYPDDGRRRIAGIFETHPGSGRGVGHASRPDNPVLVADVREQGARLHDDEFLHVRVLVQGYLLSRSDVFGAGGEIARTRRHGVDLDGHGIAPPPRELLAFVGLEQQGNRLSRPAAACVEQREDAKGSDGGYSEYRAKGEGHGWVPVVDAPDTKSPVPWDSQNQPPAKQ